MRILSVSDKVEPVLYSPYIRERVGKVDLVLACGDLPYYYLEYIIGLLDVPLFFVHGNHDKTAEQVEPGASSITWATNLHRRTLDFNGLLLAGLEGSPVYNPGAPFQYTEAQARWQVWWLAKRLWLNRLRRGRYVDILVTHAPPRGIHDAQDVAHRGFQSYLRLLRWLRGRPPVLMIHGHSHVYNRNQTMDTEFDGTRIINTYGYRVIELEPNGNGWRLVSARS